MQAKRKSQKEEKEAEEKSLAEIMRKKLKEKTGQASKRPTPTEPKMGSRRNSEERWTRHHYPLKNL